MAPMRLASLSIRPIAVATSSGVDSAPCRYSSENPRMVTSGVRSSCEASAAKRRIRASDAIRAAKAVSMCASMALSELPSRPTSVLGFSISTRRDRSPAAIAAAVFSTRASGRKDREMVHVAMKNARTRVSRPDAHHHQGGVFHDGIDRPQRQPDDDDGAALVAVHDVERRRPASCRRRCRGPGRGSAGVPAASTAEMVVMSGWESLSPPNGTGGCPGAKSISE